MTEVKKRTLFDFKFEIEGATYNFSVEAETEAGAKEKLTRHLNSVLANIDK